MNKKILIICIIALVVLSTSATLVISSIEGSHDKSTCIENEDGKLSCNNICSWCYITSYQCNDAGTCC